MTTFFRSWCMQVLVASCVALAGYSPCVGANSTDELGGANGKYNAADAAPDNLTTTTPKPGITLEVIPEGCTSAPDRVFDQGKVRLTAHSGPTATFSGRSTSWGCTYTVQGKEVSTGGTGSVVKWTNTFEEYATPRILLEVNENGAADDAVLLGDNGGKVWVLLRDTTETVDIRLEANPAALLSNLPATIHNVTATTWQGLPLTGASPGGVVTITASATINGNQVSTSITAKVLAFRGKIHASQDFNGRTYQKWGVCEKGFLTTDVAPGVTHDDLKDLTWAVAAGTAIKLSNVEKSIGYAQFEAEGTPGEATLSLTDKNGNQMLLPIAVIQPSGVYQVKGVEGQRPGFRGAYMGNYSYLLPKDVSFYRILVREGTCKADGTGTEKVHDGEPHSPWSWRPGVSNGNISTGCLVKGPESAGSHGLATTLPYDYLECARPLNWVGPGTFEWNIPWLYTTIDGKVTDKEFTRVLQHAYFDANGKCTLTKAGTKTEQAPP